MLNDWGYENEFENKYMAARRMMEAEREYIRHVIELTKWKQEIERATPYSPPLTFEQKIDKLTELLEKYGPKLAALADVMGAMRLDEKDNS